MTERRFSEAEVAAIFERATKAQQHDPSPLSAGDGLTLAELQDIGREVGLTPDLIVQAALTIDTGGRQTSRTFFGIPIGVGRTVELGRRLSDDEWERLVVDLRDTFDARGVMRGEGSLRQWTNGNLQALLEPTATGHRLRLRTFKGEARTFVAGGFILIGLATATLVTALFSARGIDGGVLFSCALPGLAGLTLLTSGAMRVSRWAELRRQQMESIIAKLTRTTLAPPTNESASKALPG